MFCNVKATKNGNNGGGRKKDDDIWMQFSIKKDSNSKSATCNKCGDFFKWAKVERLKKHLQTCGIQEQQLPKQNLKNAKPSVNDNDVSVIEATGSKSVEFQQKLPTMFKKIANEHQKIDSQVAKFIFGCNLPFSTADNPEFVKLMQRLRPSYKPPSAKTIGGSLLNKIYEEICEDARKSAETKFATLMQDGWSAIQQSPVISHCLSIEANGSIIVNAVATTTDTKDAAYCATLAMEALEDAEDKFGCQIGAVVTDNCSTMILMRKLISQKRPDLWTYGCNTHYLNLVGKEVVPDAMMKTVKNVQHFFRDKQYPRESLKKYHGLQPVLPVETRWNTQYDCLKNFTANHSKYLDILKDEKCNAGPIIIENLTDLNFYKSTTIRE